MWSDFKNFVKSFNILAKRTFDGLGNVLVKVFTFLGPVENSLKGVINPEEFYRVTMLAATSGGGLYGAVQYLQGHLQEFITDPNLVSGVTAFIDHVHHKRLPLAFFTVVFLGDYCRRKWSHGDKE